MSRKVIDLEALIGCVFERPAIWDRDSKNHSKRHIVEKSWAEISSAMEIDEPLLRKKWKYLRDQFAVELGRRPQSKWPYLHLLMFLKKSVKVRKPGKWRRILVSKSDESTAATSKAQPTKLCKASDSDVEPSEPSTLASPSHSVDNISQEAEETCSCNKLSLLSSTQPCDQEKSVNGKNCQSKDSNDSVLETEKQKLQYALAKPHKKWRTEDDDDDCDELFLKSLMIHIKKIPECKKLLFRNKIQEVVQEFAYPDEPSSNTMK